MSKTVKVKQKTKASAKPAAKNNVHSERLNNLDDRVKVLENLRLEKGRTFIGCFLKLFSAR